MNFIQAVFSIGFTIAFLILAFFVAWYIAVPLLILFLIISGVNFVRNRFFYQQAFFKKSKPIKPTQRAEQHIIDVDYTEVK